MSERRFGHRVPFEMLLNEYVGDRLHRCMTTNLSETGLYLHKLITPPVRKGALVQLEFELPGTGEVIWARGEIAYQEMDAYFHGTGVHLTGIPQLHARLLRDYVRERRKQRLLTLLERIRDRTPRPAPVRPAPPPPLRWPSSLYASAPSGYAARRSES